MLIKSFLSEQAKQARRRAEAQHQDALDLEQQAQERRKSATENEVMAEELERLAGQYPDEEPAQTPGAAGREVQHVDAPDDDQPIRYVWLTKDECTEEQRAMAVGEHDGRWAIAVENCTPDQLVGRAICEL